MKILKNILEIFFPTHCISCEKIISQDALFCSDCWQKLQFITNPKCKICSYPFDVEISFVEPICSRCLIKKPFYDKAITIFRYNKIIRKIIGDLKYRDQTFLAKKLGKILAEKAKSEIIEADIIIAIPLHKKRLQKRKFNQVTMICKNLDKSKFISDFLQRRLNTIPQIQLRKKEREKNLKRVFIVNKKYLDLVKDKKILLLDDVMTTGATLDNCAKELKRRGAKEVKVLTIAKTVFHSAV